MKGDRNDNAFFFLISGQDKWLKGKEMPIFSSSSFIFFLGKKNKLISFEETQMSLK